MAIQLKWKPELFTNGLNIISMKMEHLVLLDSVSFLPCVLRKVPVAFGLQAAKSWYLHYFHIEDNLDYVGPMPYIFYYFEDEMVEGSVNNT